MTFIEELFEFIATAGGIMPHYKAYRGNFHGRPITFYKSLDRLENRGLIKKKKRQNREYIYVVTHKGRKILSKPKKKISRTDGLSSLITFDIPESQKRARNTFRRYLIRNGFTLVQKSLLVSPDKINDDTLDLIHELKIKPFVKIISGKFDYL